MPKQDSQHNRSDEQKKVAAQSAEATHQHHATRAADLAQAVAQLRQAVEEKQKDLSARHARENRLLDSQQQARQQELASLAAQERAQAAPGNKVDRKSEISSLDRYQATQKNQVNELQAREQTALRERAEAINNLEARSRQQMKAVDHLQDRMEQTGRLSSEAQKELDQLRQRLVLSYSEQRGQLEAAFRNQDQLLQGQRERIERQMDRDQQQFEQQLFSQQQGIEQREALLEALSRQEATHQELKHFFQAELNLQVHQEQDKQAAALAAKVKETAILDQKFSHHPVIRALWQEAVAAISARQTPDLSTPETARQAYNRAIKAFVTRLTRENDARSAEARQIFTQAGFKFQQDRDGKLKKNLPILDLPGVAEKLDLTRHADLLRISGQHLQKIKDRPEQALQAENLAFMIARDNMYMDLEGKKNLQAEITRKRQLEEQENRI